MDDDYKKEKKLIEMIEKRMRCRYWKCSKRKKECVDSCKPKELKILWLAKGSGLTYKQVRTRLNILVDCGILEKYSAWSALNRRRNFYRSMR